MSFRLFLSVALAALTGLLGPASAVAQTAAAATISFPPLSAAGNLSVQQPELLSLKSEKTAFYLSLFGTLGPFALGTALAATNGGDEYSDGTLGAFLIYTGIYVGPSLGYFYAGKTGRGLAGFGLRNAIGLASVLGAVAICPYTFCDDDQAGAAAVVLLAGGIGILTSAIYDVAKVQSTVRERNERALARQVMVTPTYSRSSGPGVRVSLAVR